MMGIWIHWGWIEFLCYSVFLLILSSTLTVWFTHRDTIEKLVSKNLEMYKLKQRRLSFHKYKEKPQDAEKRIFPPLHPGGPVEKEIDTFIISKMREGMTIKQAWDEALKNNFYPENVVRDIVYMRGEYNNMKKRVKNRYSKSNNK